MSDKHAEKKQALAREREETEYYKRLIVMFIDLGTDTLLKLFKSLIPQGDIRFFLNSNSDKIEELKNNYKLSPDEYRLITKSTLVETELDVAILIKLMFGLLPRQLEHAWLSNSPPLKADLQRLRKIRNNLVGHRPEAKITKEKFICEWDMTCLILNRILPNDKLREELDRRIKHYKTRTLDASHVEKILDLLNTLSSLVKQTKELGERIKEFQLFFKRTPELFVRYVKLLFDGGHLVLLGVLHREINKAKISFDRLIRKNWDKMPKNIQSILTALSPSSLDISVLAEVILILFGDRISQSDNKNIRIIRDARNEYADSARLSLDASKFISKWTTLIRSLDSLSMDIDKKSKGECDEIIQKYQDENNDDTTVDEYLNKLKTNGMEIRTLEQAYEDMMSELKTLFERMEVADLQHTSELEMHIIIHCKDSSKKRGAEDYLLADFQTALQITDKSDANQQSSELESMLKEIAEIGDDVTITGVKRKCILLVLQFSTCRAVKHFLHFVQSANFQLHIENISRMLCLEYLEPISIQAKLTFESMKSLKDQMTHQRDYRHKRKHGVSLSIECSSATGVRHVVEVLKKEKITNALNKVADTLSARFGKTISLHSVPDFKEFNEIFHEKDLSTDDSSTSNDDESADRFDKCDKEKMSEQMEYIPINCQFNTAQRTKNHGKLIVAAIDFGTTYSGYAYSFKDTYQRDPLQIFSHLWTDGTGLSTSKVPTIVLFDKAGKFHSFGYEAEEKYAQLSSSDKHIKWKYFRHFKMTLHNKPNLSLKTKLRDDQGKRMAAIEIFTAAIKYLKTHLWNKLTESHHKKQEWVKGNTTANVDISPDDILWVLTVPAIWSDSAKQFMRVAAVQAGIPEGQLLLALEPEAAAIFSKTAVLSKNEIDKASVFEKDSQFMVIDLGGGTVDITVHKVHKDGKLHEVYPPSGGPWGGTLVDEHIYEFLENLFGRKILQILKNESATETLDMLRTLEFKKRQFKVTDEDDRRVNLTLPSSLYEIYDEENPEERFQDKLKSLYTNKIERKRGRLIIDQDVFHEMFVESINCLTKHLKAICRRHDMGQVNSLILVGGYSECDVLKRSIKETFTEKRVIVPEEASSAVVKGAVLFGHNPDIIDSRRAPCTYGISTAVPFDYLIHPAMHKHQDMCEDVFKVFIPIGTEIVPGKTQVTHSFNTAQSSSVEIYKSISEQPSFITDPGCEKVGEIDISGTTGEATRVDIIMKFGDTELHVEAKEQDTENKVSAKFNFLR